MPSVQRETPQARAARLRAEADLADAEAVYDEHRSAYLAAQRDYVNAAAKGAADVAQAVSQARREFEQTPAAVQFRVAGRELSELRADYRANHRRKPDGPGDAAPSPDVHEATGAAKRAAKSGSGS